jgi:CBS domain-containing protein
MTYTKFVASLGITLREACIKIQLNDCRGLILQRQGVLHGILTEGDIIRGFINGARPSGLIDEYVNVSAISFMNTDVKRRVKFLEYYNQGITIVPVVDSLRTIVSIITIKGEINAP